MKESDWLSCNEIEKLLKLLPKLTPQPSDRKLRLYCVGCCRSLGPLLDEPCRQAVDVAEKYADGQATLAELTAAHKAAGRRHRTFPHERMAKLDMDGWARENTVRTGWRATDGTARPAKAVLKKTAEAVLLAATVAGGHAKLYESGPQTLALLAALLHEVVGNPFRQPSIDPTWLAWNGGTIPRLAQTIYEERVFDRLPILADALEEAGCIDAAILEHCRGPGPHVRGCWVIDLLLEKT